MRIWSTATNLHHIFHPLTREKPEPVERIERIVGVALLIFLSIASFSLFGFFCLATAVWKVFTFKAIAKLHLGPNSPF